MQLNQLWQFMQVDMETDRFEAKIRQSEKRQTLLKQQNFLLEQQKNMERLQNEVATMSDRLEAVRDESERLQKQLSALSEDLAANPPQSAEEADARMVPVQKLLETLTRYEQELTKLRKDAEARDRQQHDIRVSAARTKASYDKLKSEYDVEFKRDRATLKKMRERTDQEASKLDASLLARYRSIKQHSTPPMAKLINGQCSGCFMALPSATLLKLKDSDELILCDNCGRILYIEE